MAERIGVLLTGGGTAGHIYPLIAVAKKLPAGTDIRYFGDAGEFAPDLKNAQVKIHTIASSKLRRYFSLLNFLDAFKFLVGLFQALWKIYWFMPNVAFSKGGPGALSVIAACHFYRIPIVIHESDVVPGLTNIASAKYAKILELNFPVAKASFPKFRNIVRVVGNPVREELLSSRAIEEAKKIFGLDPKRPVVLFLGGSQGAVRLNEFVLEHLGEFLDRFQVLHLVGQGPFSEYKGEVGFMTKNLSPVLKNQYKFFPFLGDNFGDALDAADVIVSRSGAGHIFEAAAKGKPSILVPLPGSAGDHQAKNAYAYASTGAAVVIQQENLLPSIFLNQISAILGNQEALKKMSEAARKFYQPDSAKKIADDIMSLTV